VEKAWLIASSNKKSLENLRERQFLSHKETQEREDQKLLDELVILRRGQLI
jgi:flagellar export protein FliJ